MITPNRARLLARLAEVGDARLLLLCAPAGYGKTRTVDTWLAEVKKTRRDTLRLRIFAGSAESLWDDVLRDVSEAMPGIAPRGGTAFERVMRLAAALTSPAIVVVDDYHLATTPENDLALAKLVAANPRLTLIVNARRVSVLDGPLIAGLCPVHVLGPDDLTLTMAEMRALADGLGVRSSERLESALAQTGGWPLAVRAALSGRSSRAESSLADFDPLVNLSRFSQSALAIASPPARAVLLAASLLDAIDLPQAAETAGCGLGEARAAIDELVEAGSLIPVVSDEAVDYACRMPLTPTLASLAARELTGEQRAALLASRADRVSSTAPFTAFALFCRAERYAEAESLLGRFFTTITDEAGRTAELLRDLPDGVLHEHPVFCAARLFIDRGDPSIAPDALARLTDVMREAAGRRLDLDPQELDPEQRLVAQSMALSAARLSGDVAQAQHYAGLLEGQLTATAAMRPLSVHGPRAAIRSPGPGAFPTYSREIALAGLSAGDYGRARRNWRRLIAHADLQIAAQWRGFPRASTRTVTDAESGRNWKLAALGGLALTEMLDGDMRGCSELLAEAGLLAAQGACAPPVAGAAAEVARAHLAYEREDEQQLLEAVESLTPLSDRLDLWPLLLIATAETTRYRSGVDWAVAHIDAELARRGDAGASSGTWLDYLTIYRAMLCTVRGSFGAARAVLKRLPHDLPIAQIELARLDLFLGREVQALVRAGALGDTGLTIRHRLDRSLIAACAAWLCGKRDEAFTALRSAAGLVERFELPSLLWSVPSETLAELADAARDAGVCDLADRVAAIPSGARCVRYGRLTEMELRTLRSIADHESVGGAAAALFVTPATVKKHLNAVYRKLRARGRVEAVLQATRMGLLEGPTTEARRPIADLTARTRSNSVHR